MLAAVNGRVECVWELLEKGAAKVGRKGFADGAVG